MTRQDIPASGYPFRSTSGLFTDLYELNMAAVYLQLDMTQPATFSLFCRRLPRTRPFIVACGLEELLAALESLRFSDDELEYLRSLGLYDEAFLAYLSGFRFSGTIRAAPEGTPIFANEPLLEVEAPLPEAQLVETLAINKIQHPTLVASKAALCYLAAAGRTLVDFGARRAHSTESAAAAARAAYIAGFEATSNVEAARLYGIPPSGTMAHSFVMAFDDEETAFEAFAERYREKTVLLIDTYDTLKGAEKAVRVARRFEARGIRLRGVRIDSGDLVKTSQKVREILDREGASWMQIFASGNLSESRIAEAVAAKAPIDAFGVGTELTTSSDAPSLDMAYKLVRYGERDVYKLSPGKATYPGPKQVLRMIDPSGQYVKDVLVPADSEERIVSEIQSLQEDGQIVPLLVPVMENGVRTGAGLESLKEKRERFLEAIGRFDPEVKKGAKPYDVEIHPSLEVSATGG
jgi:nicotinate phosphoribosyltransferase